MAALDAPRAAVPAQESLPKAGVGTLWLVYVLVMVGKAPFLRLGAGGVATPPVLPMPGSRPGAEGTRRARGPVLAQ